MMALSEFERLQTREIVREVLKEIKGQLVTKNQLYLWALGILTSSLTLVTGILIYVIKTSQLLSKCLI